MKRETNLLKASNNHPYQLYFTAEALVKPLSTRDLLFKWVPLSVEISLKSARLMVHVTFRKKERIFKIFNQSVETSIRGSINGIYRFMWCKKSYLP